MSIWPKTAEPVVEKDPDNAETPPAKTPAELIAESLSPITTAISALNDKLNTIEQATKKPAPKVEPAEQTSVLDDENAAFAQRLTPLMLRQLELEARIVKNDIKAEYTAAGYGELWAQFDADINKVIDESPIVTNDGRPLRGDPQYLRNVVDMIFGREARKSGMRFDGKSKGFFLEGASGSTEHSAQPQNDGLSDGQRKVFSRMKVPLEDAKKVMGKLKFLNS